MSRGDRNRNRPTVRAPAGADATRRRRPPRTDSGAAGRLVRDAMLFGLLVAGVGVLFLGIFTASDLLWGSYFGADPGIGQALSLGVMTVGVAIATLLWVGREVGMAARQGIRRARSSR